MSLNLKKELLVSGYVRENYRMNVPEDIIRECLKILSLSDAWNTDSEIDAGKVIVSEDNSVRAKKGNHGKHLIVFGTDTITRGNRKRWMLSGRDTDIDKMYYSLIGVFDKSKLETSFKAITSANISEFAYSMQGNGSVWHGSNDEKMPFDQLKSELYGEQRDKAKWKTNGTIAMELDLTADAGTLRFIINDFDFGVAFDDIDVDKPWVLVLELYGTECVHLLQ